MEVQMSLHKGEDFDAIQSAANKLRLAVTETVQIIYSEKHSPWRSNLINRNTIEIDRLLGEYSPCNKTITIYLPEIRECAERLSVSVEDLQSVVEIHEAVHAVVHVGRDADDRYFELTDYCKVDDGADPSPMHETLAQLTTFHCTLNDKKLSECFFALNSSTSSVYRKWEPFKAVQVERVRDVLIAMRRGKAEKNFETFTKILI